MSSTSPPPSPDDQAFDPVYLNSRREAVVIFGVWVACLLWAVPYCYFFGYPSDGAAINPDAITTIWGIPSWVFWGILVPWLAADAFTIWFCFFYMVDDDLGEANEGIDVQEEIEERHAAEKEAGQ